MTGMPKDQRPGVEAARQAEPDGPTGAEFAGVGLRFAISCTRGLSAGHCLP